VSTSVRERAPSHGAAANGGLAARRAVIRWAWRLLRREWRQQLLILALIIVAVAATFVGAAAATTTPVPATAGFGTAQDSETFLTSGSRLAAQTAALQHRFGRADVIENQTLRAPGTVFTYDLRAQNPHGTFGGPMLSLQSGHYPATPGQVAITSGLASQLHLRVGDTWRVGGSARQVVGIVANPQNLVDEFALVLPGLVTSPTRTTVLFDAPGVDPSSTGRNVSTPARVAAAALGTSDVITLETASANLQHAAAGRNWNGSLYVATPQLLSAFGISQSQVNPTADILTMRPGLSTLSKMQLIYGTLPCAGTARGCPPGPGGEDTLPCLTGHCVNNPVIQQLSALPSGTSAPNTLITERAIRQLGLGSSISIQGELIRTAQPLTASQIHSAQQAASAAGASVETRNSIPSFSEILDVTTVLGILLALGILAMSVGLVRSETAGDLRTLTATGASSLARRTITAATAGALALAGAVIGVFCAYLAAIGFFRTNQLDGMSELSSVPVADLLLILVGMPLVAVIAGWLLAGRQPSAIGRQPME